MLALAPASGCFSSSEASELLDAPTSGTESSGVVAGSASSTPGSASSSTSGLTASTGSTTAPSTGTGASTTGGPQGGVGSCCEEQRGPGCDDADVTACACAVDDYCCDTAWDALCIDLAQDLGCHVCGATPPRSTGDCCVADGGVGCLDLTVATCVCDADPFCCMVAWDEVCVDQVEALGCGICTRDRGTTGGEPGSCCEAGTGPGCDQPDVQSCVCDLDPFCCDEAWDDLCVDTGIDAGCGACEGATGGMTSGGSTYGGASSSGGSSTETGFGSTGTGWGSGA